MNVPAPTVMHYVGYDQDGGGILSVVRALAAGGQFACVLGVNPGFVSQRPPPLATVALPRIAGESLGPRTFWRARRVAHAAWEWLAADSARVFHAHSRAGLAVALWLARRRETRMLVSVHCYGRQRWFYRWAARRLQSRLFWLSPAMKRYYGLADAGSWRDCVPGCFALPDELIRERRTPARVVRIGGIGTLVPWKRWHLVLDALARLPGPVRERLLFCHIGGGGPGQAGRRYVSDLRALTESLGLSTMVEWRGDQPSSATLLREIDCLVIASGREPLSVAMLEALAAGVPVLAAASGGACDVIVPARNGWFFRPDDARDLARQLTMLVESDVLRATTVGRADVARFEAAAVAGQWAGIYRRLLAGGTGGEGE